jgi:hypothetical protein
MKDLIIDFETMGSEPTDCAVIDCSVMVFDWDRFTSDNPYTVRDIKETRKFKLSVADQVKNYDYKVEQGVLDFWQQQSKEVRANIKPRADDLTVEEFVKQFHDFVIDSNVKHWWSRSNTFDPVILTRLFDSQGKKQHMYEYLKFYLVRDTRTYIDAKFDFQQKKNGFCPVSDEEGWERTFKAHDSSWDILADVMRLQAIVRAENDMEQVTL